MKRDMLNHNHDLSTKMAIILGISKIAIGLFILIAGIMLTKFHILDNNSVF